LFAKHSEGAIVVGLPAGWLAAAWDHAAFGWMSLVCAGLAAIGLAHLASVHAVELFLVGDWNFGGALAWCPHSENGRMHIDGKRAYELQLAASGKGLDQLTATSLSADEGLSRPYAIRVLVHSLIPGDPGSFDPGSWLRKTVGVGLARDADPTWFHGLVVAVDHVGTDQDHRQIFSLELAPALSLLQLTRRTRVFLDQKPLDVVKSVLSEGSVTIDLKATGAGGVMRHITQFEESDFAFVSRLLEQEGACYWFTHTKSAHTMVIGDAANHHPGKDATIHGSFTGAPKAGPEGEGVVTELSHRFEIASKEAFVRDYSEGHPKQTAMGQKSAPTLPGIGGKHHEADYHVTMTDADATAYASRLAEALVGRTSRLVGVSGVLAYRAGARVAVAGKEDYAEHLLLTEVRHTFADDSYRNTFQAVPVGRLPWRPLRSTPIPRIDGLVPAIVTSAAGDQGQGIDGSYKVRLLNSDDTQERVVRMAQPNTGPSQGIHFPLPVNTEVMLSHAYGHPDRPIIAGAMHNGEDASQILEANKTQAVIRTPSNHSLVFEDKGGSESITFTSSGDWTRSVARNSTTSVGGNDSTSITGTADAAITKDASLDVSDGNLTVTVAKNLTVATTGITSFHADESGTGLTATAPKITLTADSELKLVVGGSSITITASDITLTAATVHILGTTTVTGPAITLTADNDAKVTGSALKLKGTATAELKGPAVTVHGDTTAELNSPAVTVSGTATVTIGGGQVAINQ